MRLLVNSGVVFVVGVCVLLCLFADNCGFLCLR